MSRRQGETALQLRRKAVSCHRRCPLWARWGGPSQHLHRTQVVYSLRMKNISPSPQIRPALISDVSAMFHVRGAVGENTMTTEELSAIGVTPDSISLAVIGSPCSWVATVAEEVVGFAMVELESACLFALFVLPTHEGRGIGTELTHACEQALFKRHTAAWLETAKGSRAARLYQHLGWGGEVDIGGGDIRLEKRRE